MKQAPSFLLALAIACGVACSSNHDTGASSSPSPDASSPDTVSVLISAADGGTVQAAGVTLTIPPGALAADTTITATPLDPTAQPDAASIAGKVYDFGPSGTTFQKPVTLTFDITGTAPADKVTKVAFLEGGAWQTLDSTVTGTKVEAQTAHFTPYTVVFADAAEQPDGGGQTAVQCTKDFTPCGGDLVGTWKFTAGCAYFPSGLKDGACQSSSTSVTIGNIAGSAVVTFNADMTYSIQQTYDMTYTYIEPSSCYGGSCAIDTTDNGDGTCTKTKLQSKLNTETGTYTTAATSFTTTGTVVASAADYCVQGNTLYWATHTAALETYFTLTKQ